MRIVFILKILVFITAVCVIRLKIAKSVVIIQNLGGFFIKLGQFLSTRPDLVSLKVSQILLQLQYNVGIDRAVNLHSTIPSNLAEEILELHESPIKSASIAQIYKGKLKNGSEIAVKIVKPQERTSITADLENFTKLVNMLPRWKCLARFNFREIALNIKSAMLQELNLENEAKNIAEFRYLFADYNKISAPRVYFEYSNADVLVMEFICGKVIGEIAGDVNFCEKTKLNIAKLLLDAHLIQVYMHHKFHADVHHNNIMYGENGVLYFIDFGIYSEISVQDSNAILEIIRAFLRRDYTEIAKIHQQIGYVPTGTNLEDFSISCKEIGDLYLDKEQFSIGQIFRSLMQVSSKFGMEIQPQLVLLQKTMIMTEGVVKSLQANANIWQMSSKMIDKIYLKLAIYRCVRAVKSVKSAGELPSLFGKICSIIKGI